MARFTRIQVIQKMNETGMVPLFFHSDLEIAKNILNACYKGGARLMEFTSRGDYAHEIFGELSKYAMDKLPEMILGVGSITDASQASLYMSLGSNFIVTPVLRRDIAIVCNRRKVLWSAGCGTLTEIADAEELGAEIVKLFPGSTYGPNFVESVLAPQPWTSIMPTGGVSPTKDNLKSWFDAGVVCVGMGSKLMSKNDKGLYNYKKIEDQTKKSLNIIRLLKKNYNNSK